MGLSQKKKNRQPSEFQSLGASSMSSLRGPWGREAVRPGGWKGRVNSLPLQVINNISREWLDLNGLFRAWERRAGSSTAHSVTGPAGEGKRCRNSRSNDYIYCGGGKLEENKTTREREKNECAWQQLKRNNSRPEQHLHCLPWTRALRGWSRRAELILPYYSFHIPVHLGQQCAAVSSDADASLADAHIMWESCNPETWSSSCSRKEKKKKRPCLTSTRPPTNPPK